jgi:hypothetical protein
MEIWTKERINIDRKVRGCWILLKEYGNNWEECSCSAEIKYSCHISGGETENYAKRLYTFLSKPVHHFTLSTCSVVWSSKLCFFFVFVGNMAYCYISPTHSRYQIKPYEAVILLYTSVTVIYDHNAVKYLWTPLYCSINNGIFSCFLYCFWTSLEKIAGDFLKQNF